MTPLRVCPSTLADGFDTYSPAAQKALFDGKAVSPFLDIDTPAANTAAPNRKNKAPIFSNHKLPPLFPRT